MEAPAGRVLIAALPGTVPGRKLAVAGVVATYLLLVSSPPVAQRRKRTEILGGRLELELRTSELNSYRGGLLYLRERPRAESRRRRMLILGAHRELILGHGCYRSLELTIYTRSENVKGKQFTPRIGRLWLVLYISPGMIEFIPGVDARRPRRVRPGLAGRLAAVKGRLSPARPGA